MLKAEIDFEIIRSSLLAGEIDDAAAWVKKAMRNIEVYKRVTKSSKYDARLSFLKALMAYLSGDMDFEDLKQTIHRTAGIRDTFVPRDEFDEFMESFLYYVHLAVDRYNVRYPSFDGKRCDDK